MHPRSIVHSVILPLLTAAASSLSGFLNSLFSVNLWRLLACVFANPPEAEQTDKRLRAAASKERKCIGIAECHWGTLTRGRFPKIVWQRLQRRLSPQSHRQRRRWQRWWQRDAGTDLPSCVFNHSFGTAQTCGEASQSARACLLLVVFFLYCLFVPAHFCRHGATDKGSK